MYRKLAAYTTALVLVACGGGDEVPPIQAQAARPQGQAQQAAAVVTTEQVRVFVALRGRAPTAAEAAAFGSQAGSALGVALAATLANTPDPALSTVVLTNLGVTPQTVAPASYTILQDALAQFFAAYGSASRGVIANNLAGLLAGLPADATWGLPARALNTMVANASAVLNCTAVASGCTTQQMALGLATSGAWTADDCVDSTLNVRYDEYDLQLTAQAAFRAQVDGAQGRQFRIFTAEGRAVGAQPSDPFAPAAVNPLEIQYVLPAGSYRLRVYSPAAGTTGNYTLALVNAFSNAASGATCMPVSFITYNTSTTQNLSRASSCAYQGGTEDRYILLLREGERVSLSLETGAFAPFLILRDDRTVTGPAVAVQRLTAPGRAAVSYTATFTGFHEIIVTSNDFTSQGQYTLAVTSP